jgi:UDP-N-acetylmuramate--alanine ligase
MMEMSNISTIYFVGIGGIGMSAIARYFAAHGKVVAGYDRTETPLTRTLQEEGMDIHYEDNIQLLPSKIDLVVYTPAVPANHHELLHLRALGIPVMKRAEVLGLISNGQQSIGVAGTHGKTTTSVLLSHILKTAGLDISAFLGGISVDYHTNCLIGKSDVVVLEADEYDRSFLHLHPYIASVASMDPDHLDIYGDKNTMVAAYKAYASGIQNGGALIIRENLKHAFSADELADFREKNIQFITFGQDAGDVRIENMHASNGMFVFDYKGPGGHFAKLNLSLPGRHNVENAVVAVTIALLLGVEESAIRTALFSFRGIKRRFERIVDTGDIVYIDDYAHHPSELEAAIDAARTLYPGRRITGIFQPHLFTRTRDFAEGFAAALDKLDEVILMDIYPARELPIAGVDAGIIFNKMKNKYKQWLPGNQVLKAVHDMHPEVLMTLGAGDIDLLIPDLKEMLKQSSI